MRPSLLESPPVVTCDGNALLAADARKLSRRMFLVGFLGLPWLWLANVWLFWHDFWMARDPVVAKYTRRSGTGFAVVSAALFTWIGLYLTRGRELLGDSAYDALDIGRINLRGAGLGG